MTNPLTRLHLLQTVPGLWHMQQGQTPRLVMTENIIWPARVTESVLRAVVAH